MIAFTSSTMAVDRVAYFVAHDHVTGWSTGPCATVADAEARLISWMAGEEVTEAAPGQASRGQMAGALAIITTRLVPRDNGECKRLLQAAIKDGLHSEAWVRASARVARLVYEPEVANAPSVMIRRVTAASGAVR